MARRRGGIFYHWQVTAFALFMIAMPVSLHLLRADSTAPHAIRIELPPALPLYPGAGARPDHRAQRIAFDVSRDEGGASAATAIEARKSVILNGVNAGEVSVRVSSDSNLLLRRDELRRLLVGTGQGALAEMLGAGEFITFSDVLRLGINVRYDAASDSIQISL
jgi:hypothetical protein